MVKTVKLCLASVQRMLTCMTSPLNAKSLSILEHLRWNIMQHHYRLPGVKSAELKCLTRKKKQWNILILSSLRNLAYDKYKIPNTAWKNIKCLNQFCIQRDCLSLSLSYTFTDRHTHTHTQSKKQKGKVIAAGRTGTYWGWRINVSTAFSQRITHAHTHTYTHTHTDTHTYTRTNTNTHMHAHTTFHGSSVYKMLSAALCTVIKDHLQSFIICVSLSVDQHVCLFIFPPPLLFLFFPVGSSSSSFYIYVYFQFSSCLFFYSPPNSSLLSISLPFSHVPSRLRSKLNYLNGNMYGTFACSYGCIRIKLRQGQTSVPGESGRGWCW